MTPSEGTPLALAIQVSLKHSLTMASDPCQVLPACVTHERKCAFVPRCAPSARCRAAFAEIGLRGCYTLNLNNRMSPSFTT